MKKNITIPLILLVLLILGGLAYKYFSDNLLNEVSINTNQTANDIKEPDSAIINEPTEMTAQDKNDFYDIKAVYPNDPLDKNKVIEKFINDSINAKKEEWQVGGQAYDDEKKLEVDFPDRPKMQFQYYINYKKSESAKLASVSYLFSIYEFTGGANGNTTLAAFTFDQTGLKNIEDILNLADNNNDITLTKALAYQMETTFDKNDVNKEMINSGLGLAYLESDGVTVNKERCRCDGFFFGSNLQNFMVNDSGIDFYFNQYQVAPGAAGTPDVLLSWEILRPYLKPDIATKVMMPSTGLANPASVNCFNKGGTLIMKDNKNGQYGVCVFDDNRQCEEWALFRGECPVGGRKITGYETEAQTFCAITGGTVQGLGTDNVTCKKFDGTVCGVDKNFNGECVVTQ